MALEKMATKVGKQIMPSKVPSEAEPMRIRNWFSTNMKALSEGALSIKLPVKGCCIIFDNLETITITLKSDKADANKRTRAQKGALHRLMFRLNE